VVESYQRATGLNIHAACQSTGATTLTSTRLTRTPGLPLLRMTFEFGENEHKIGLHHGYRAVEIAQAMVCFSSAGTRRRTLRHH